MVHQEEEEDDIHIHKAADPIPNPNPSFKICLLPHRPLASALRRLSSPPMSSASLPLRPLFPLLLLAALAATFTCRFSLSLSLSSSPPSASHIDPPVFNSTLVNLAQSDPGEPRLRQEIDLLIDGDFEKLSRFRPFLLWRRFTAAIDLRGRSFRLTPVNLRSPAFYRFYLHFRSLLSDWSRRRDLPPDQAPPEAILSDLLPLLSRRRKYSSCAVVGNSGILLNADHGAAIDAHEAVIRLNNARIGGFAGHVGAKTTISFVNSNILHLCGRRRDCPCYPYGAGVPLVLYICQPIHFLDFATCNASSVALNRSPILVTDPNFDLLCSKIVKYYSLRKWFADDGSVRNRTLEGWSSAHDGMLFHYSSGMQAVVMAAGVCEKVSLFGFGKAATAKHHYHTNQKAELQLHDYEAEYEFYRDLMERPHAIPFLWSNREIRFPPVQIYH